MLNLSKEIDNRVQSELDRWIELYPKTTNVGEELKRKYFEAMIKSGVQIGVQAALQDFKQRSL